MKRIIELIKYSFFGGLTTVINLALFAILEQAGMNYILASSISYVVAVVINYFFNKQYVFGTARKSKKESRTQFIKFISMRLISLGIENVLLYLLVSVIGIQVYVAKITLSIVIILLTYVANKRIIFKKHEEST